MASKIIKYPLLDTVRGFGVGHKLPYMEFTPSINRSNIKNYFNKVLDKDWSEVFEQVFKVIQNYSNASRRNIVKNLDDKVLPDKSSLIIKLPVAPINVGLKHEYLKSQVYVGSLQGQGVRRIIKRATIGAAESLSRSSVGELVGTRSLLNTAYAVSGTSYYKPTRETYQGSSAEGITYVFDFLPRNREESLEVHKIIKSFQYFSMVSHPNSLHNKESLFVNNPPIWTIRYPSSSDGGLSDKNWLLPNNTLKYMVLNSVNISYGDGQGQNMGLYSDNYKPTFMRMTLGFSFYFDLGNTDDFLGLTDMGDWLSEGVEDYD